jgi:hypothetical protein
MANNRIFYAIQQLGIKGDGDGGAYNAIHGVQSVGITTNFNLEQVFEYGQIAIYQNIEEIPDVQFTVSKVIDGWPLIFHYATVDAVLPTLAGRSTAKCIIGMAIFPDTTSFTAEGTAGSILEASGQYISSVTYTFPVEGTATEEVTLVGNSILWANDPRIALGAPTLTFAGAFDNTDEPIGTGGVVRRQSIQFTPQVVAGADVNGQYADSDVTVLPVEVHGITTSGLNPLIDGTNNYAAHIQSISVSVDFGRTELNELGHLAPYTRYIEFPTSVTTEISTISTSGDMISASECGIYSTGVGCGNFLGNLQNRTIRIATCEGTRVYTGIKNKLQSVTSNGGDTGGGNQTITYSFLAFNDFTVMQSGDPNASGVLWWTTKDNYLLNL